MGFGVKRQTNRIVVYVNWGTGPNDEMRMGMRLMIVGERYEMRLYGILDGLTCGCETL